MEDRKILELYLTRSEQAIRETEAKYGGYCYSVAMNILENRQDAQECVSDTWFSAWNSIPPHEPPGPCDIFGKHYPEPGH